MGIVLDTDVFVHAERGSVPPDWQAYAAAHGAIYLSAITVSELLVGVYRADTGARRAKRSAAVESVLAGFAVLDLTTEIARLHAQLLADLMERGQKIGAHDLIIAATALRYGFPVLTSNLKDFRRVSGLDVLPFELSEEE